MQSKVAESLNICKNALRNLTSRDKGSHLKKTKKNNKHTGSEGSADSAAGSGWKNILDVEICLTVITAVEVDITPKKARPAQRRYYGMQRQSQGWNCHKTFWLDLFVFVDYTHISIFLL